MGNLGFRRLGRTQLEVSEISLGTVELGLEYGISDGRAAGRPSRDQAADVLNQALDCGINYIDTARLYGVSEEIIGWALKSRRQEYVLASKIALPKPESRQGSLQEIMTASLHTSLRALQTDVIDVMQLHSVPMEDLRRGEVADILQSFQKAGSVRFIGATTYGEESALVVLEDGRYDCVQIAYSMLDRTLEERVLPIAQTKNVGIVVRSVLLKGSLTYRYRLLPDALHELKAAIEKLLAIAGNDASKLPEIAYRYVLAHPAVATALVGTASLEELNAGIEYARSGPLDPALVAQIRQVILADPKLLHPGNWAGVP